MGKCDFGVYADSECTDQTACMYAQSDQRFRCPLTELLGSLECKGLQCPLSHLESLPIYMDFHNSCIYTEQTFSHDKPGYI